MKRFALIAIVALADAAVAGCRKPALEERRAAVASAGSEVMPFDLEATTHVFEKLADGGRQTVVADGDDPRQVALIRTHLAEEARRFARGDFHDPAMIHGENMPGLHALVMGHDSVTITYSEVERGAAIRYRSQSAALQAALHQWFDAQLSDHGAHARERQ